jgi:hypothetical protein
MIFNGHLGALRARYRQNQHDDHQEEQEHPVRCATVRRKEATVPTPRSHFFPCAMF